MKIILTGGGTAGSVIPLLAIAAQIKKQNPDAQFLFIGTKKGQPEKELAEKYNIPFTSIHGGKLRRYFDLRNIIDIFLIIIGFFQSLFIISKFKPDIILGAGGFIQVPVIWAGKFLGKKIIIHQQDLKPSLANKLTSCYADKITVTFEKSLNDFKKEKTVLTGNPVRKKILNGDKEVAYKTFNLNKNLPVILFVGGGTGALGLNIIIEKALPKLVEFCQIIHLTGKDKKVGDFNHENYHPYEFLKDEMKEALTVADLIVSRAGMSALTEFSVLGKPIILVPLPKSHQEENALFFSQNRAANVIYYTDLKSELLTEKIKSLLNNKEEINILSENIKKIIKPEAAQSITSEIFKLVKN